MPDYSKGKIYAIRAPGTDDVYIGSTCVSLAQRMAGHRADLKRSRSCRSSKILAFPGAYIELIEDYSCNRRELLNRREGEIIRATPTAVNYQIAGRTEKEKVADYYSNNKEQIHIKNRKWALKHPEKIKEIQSRYRERRLAKKLLEQNTIVQVEHTPDAHNLCTGAQEILC